MSLQSRSPCLNPSSSFSLSQNLFATNTVAQPPTTNSIDSHQERERESPRGCRRRRRVTSHTRRQQEHVCPHLPHFNWEGEFSFVSSYFPSGCGLRDGVLNGDSHRLGDGGYDLRIPSSVGGLTWVHRRFTESCFSSLLPRCGKESPLFITVGCKFCGTGGER